MSVGDDARSQLELSAGWDHIAAQMEVYPQFYSYVPRTARCVGLAKSASIAGVGCGTGRLLHLLFQQGYRDLTGVDFSAEATRLTQGRVPTANVYVHNIVEGPLPRQFDAIFMTEVTEHLTDPVQAFRNLER